jgi:hypothetical protein
LERVLKAVGDFGSTAAASVLEVLVVVGTDSALIWSDSLGRLGPGWDWDAILVRVAEATIVDGICSVVKKVSPESCQAFWFSPLFPFCSLLFLLSFSHALSLSLAVPADQQATNETQNNLPKNIKLAKDQEFKQFNYKGIGCWLVKQRGGAAAI